MLGTNNRNITGAGGGARMRHLLRHTQTSNIPKLLVKLLPSTLSRI